MFDTPILFLIFKRPDTTKLVLDVIKKIGPKQLFIAADGPRADHPDDAVRCQETRDLVLKGIDWDCEVKTLFRDVNRGCGYGVSEAVTWFFDQVEDGIILEDDILPSESFFYFCQEMLNKYKDDKRVMHISGSNLLSAHSCRNSYLFSNYGGIWGWASWRHAWKGYDIKITDWSDVSVRNHLESKFPKPQFLFFENIFNQQFENKGPDTWDYQWWYHRLTRDGIDIVPHVNLTRNIGFDGQATHTVDVADDIRNLKAHELNFPLIHPEIVQVDASYDNELARKYYWKNASVNPGIFRKLAKKIFR